MRSLSAAVHNNNVVSLRLRRSPFSRLLHPATLRHRATLRRVVRDHFSSPFTSVSVLPVTSPRTEKLYFTGSRVKTARFLLARNISNILWPDLNEENRSDASYLNVPVINWNRCDIENGENVFQMRAWFFLAEVDSKYIKDRFSVTFNSLSLAFGQKVPCNCSREFLFADPTFDLLARNNWHLFP